MFNLRNIVNKITDKGKESNPNSPGRAGQDVDGHYTHLAEGFLCPTCMKAFPSDTELQSHYESFHAEDLGSDQGAYGLNFHSLHQEVGERYKQQQDVLSGQTPIHDNISLITDTQELHKMLREVIASRASLQTEKDHLEQRAAQLAQLNVTLKAACDEGESSQIALKERLKVVEDQLTHRESIDDAAVLRQELIQVQRVMDELNREREQERDALRAELQLFKSNDNHESLKLQMETKDLKISQLTEELNLSKNEFAELSAKYQEEQASKSKRIDEVTDLKHQMSSLMENSSKTIESLKNELNKVSEEREAFKLSLQDLQQNSENYKATSIQNVENILSQLESLTIRNEENESRLKSSQDEINMLTKQRSELKTDTIKKQQQIEESERLNESRVNKIEELKLALSQSREKITHLENEHSELVAQIQAGEGATTAIQQLTQENNSLQMKLREAREQHSKSKEELLQTIQDVKNQLSTSETAKQQLMVMLKDKEMVLNNVLEDLKASNNQRKSLDEQLSGKEAAIKDLNGSNQKLKTSIEELKKDYTSVQTALSEKTKELSDSTAKMKEIHEQLANNQLEVKNLQSVNDQLNENLKKSSSFVDELQASVKALMETKQKFEENVIDYEQEKEKLKEQCLNLETEKTKLEEANVSLNEKLNTTENQLQVIGVQRASLETTLFELQKLLAEVEEEKKDLEEEMNKNISSLAETVKNKSELLEKQEEAVQMLMTERVQCRSQLETLEITHQVKLNELKEKQNELQKELETCKQKKEALEKDLTQETEKRINLEDALKRVSLNLETTVKESSEKQKALQRSLDEVSGEKLALEVQLEGSQTEQQTLLERCYASTSEAENLHRTIADLRHKLDESRAALHELGRENQTLQLDIDKLIGRKWAEDSEVTQCTLCHQNFSVLLRKHHCRNCGQIFCNECSSKTAPIANNKKPVRVCDSCFGELTPK